MKPLYRVHSVVLIVTALGAGCLLACTAASRGEDPTATPTAPGPQTVVGGAVGAGQGGGSRCEELGTLSATSLAGTLDAKASPVSQTTAFTLPDRPAATKVKVVAVGAASDLVGKSAVLGASVNGSYRTCTHCLVVAIGCTASSCAGAALFFPRTGTATFSAVAERGGQPFAGTFNDVELEQVTLDPVTFASTPIARGACMHVTALAFGSTTSSSNAPLDGGGTSTSSTGGLDGGGDGLQVDGGDVTSGGMSSTSSGGDSKAFL